MERAARVLAALTRTLSELNALLRERGALVEASKPADVDELRRRVALKLEAFLATREERAAAEREAGQQQP
jgi:hypothetical protein